MNADGSEVPARDTTADAVRVASAGPRKSVRLRRLLVVSGVVLAAGIGAYLWWRLSAPRLPPIDLTRVDPSVAEAIEAARAKVRESPRSAEAWGRLGIVLLAHDFGAEAVGCFEQAEKLDRNDPRWPYLHALTLLRSDPDRGLPPLERAAELSRAESAPRLRLAEELLARGRLDEAERCFRAALRQSVNDPRALLGLGQIAFQRDDLVASQTHLRRAVAAAPWAKPARALLATVYQRLGDRSAADEELRAMAGLSDELIWRDAYAEAVEEARVGVKARTEFAHRLFTQGRPRDALRVLQETVRKNPDSAHARWALGRCLLYAGAFPAAEQALRDAVHLKPNRMESQYDLAVSLHRQNKHADAAACYRRTVALMPQHAFAHHNLGLCLKELGDQPGALEAFRDAVRYKPDFATAQKDLGKLLADLGRPAEAIIHLEHAVRLAPSDETRQLLEQARLRAGRADGP